MNLHTTTERAVAEFKAEYRKAYQGIFSEEVLIEGNPWFEEFLRETIASVAAEVADATVEVFTDSMSGAGKIWWVDVIEKARIAYKETGV